MGFVCSDVSFLLGRDHEVGNFFSWSFDFSSFVDFDMMLLLSTVVLVWTSVFGICLKSFNIQTLHILFSWQRAKLANCCFHPILSIQGARWASSVVDYTSVFALKAGKHEYPGKVEV